MSFRVVVLAVLLGALAWFQYGQDASAAALGQRSLDLFDSRPARSILIVGNSRTFVNDMPSMLRSIADSADSPTKFQIETSAKSGFTFKDHWSDTRTRRLLAAGWDDVILQAESGAQMYPRSNSDFLSFGARLARIAKLNEGRARLLVGWAYEPELYADPDYNSIGLRRSDHLELIKSAHAQLATNANLSLISLADPWELIRQSHPSILLTSDGNHPTKAGTYLYALAVYAALSNQRVAAVTFVPEGVKDDEAKALREAVDRSGVASAA
jgi:hypothetical protein